MNTHSSSPGEIPQSVMQQATEWFVRLRTEDPSSDECSSWFTWIEADVMHRTAFARVQQSWDIAGAVTSPVWPTPEELALSVVKKPSGGGKLRRVPLALAASLVAATFVLFVWSRLGNERISTARGQQQSAALPDGSRIELGGLTDVAIKFTRQQRLIIAGEGETYYRVARDPGRPFIVKSGPVSITALGTAFSVRREGESVSVSVTEGLIEVTSAEMGDASRIATVRASAGERVRFDQGALSSLGGHLAMDTWRRGRLKFEDEPLQVVVASVNRYASQPIEIADPALQKLHFTGTIFDESIDRWLESMEVVFPIKVRREAGRIVIEPE